MDLLAVPGHDSELVKVDLSDLKKITAGWQYRAQAIAMMEQGSRVMSAVHKRLHYAQKQLGTNTLSNRERKRGVHCIISPTEPRRGL